MDEETKSNDELSTKPHKSFPRAFSEDVMRKSRSLIPGNHALKQGAIPSFMTTDHQSVHLDTINGWNESTNKTLQHWKNNLAEQYYVQSTILEWVSHNSKWLNIMIVLCMVFSGGTSFGNVVVDTEIHPQISTIMSAVSLFFTVLMGGIKAFDTTLGVNRKTEQVKTYVEKTGAFISRVEAQQSLAPEYRTEAGELIKDNVVKYEELCNVPVISASKQRKALIMYYKMLENKRKTRHMFDQSKDITEIV